MCFGEEMRVFAAQLFDSPTCIGAKKSLSFEQAKKTFLFYLLNKLQTPTFALPYLKGEGLREVVQPG